MILTTKARYAVMAAIEIADDKQGKPLSLLAISQKQDISLSYLEQIFACLKKAEIVKSVKGPGGGYVLARNMDQITIKDVLDCVGENINPARDIVGSEAEAANSLEFHLSKNYFMSFSVCLQHRQALMNHFYQQEHRALSHSNF